MAWDFDLDDSFFPPGFGAFSGGFDRTPDVPSFFESPTKPHPGKAGPDRDSRALAEENDELRRTEVSLTEKFSQISSLNERLREQLDDCRNRFRSAIFSGFKPSNKQ
jgi:hypothetical protein